MDNKIFSAFQLTVLTISTLVYYIIKIMSINFLQPLSWLWFTPLKSLTMPLKRWMEMNVLDRVQGCNEIIVQGHGEIVDQWMEGRGLESMALARGESRRRRVWGASHSLGARVGEECLRWGDILSTLEDEGCGSPVTGRARVSHPVEFHTRRKEKINMCVYKSPQGPVGGNGAFSFQVMLVVWGQRFHPAKDGAVTLHK